MNKTSQLNVFNTVGQKFIQQFANKSFRPNDLQAALLNFLKQNNLNEFIAYGSSMSSQLNTAANSQFYGGFSTAGPLSGCGMVVRTGPCTSPSNVIQSISVTLNFNGNNVTTLIPGSMMVQKRTSASDRKFNKYAQSSLGRAIDFIMHYFDYELTHAAKNITLDISDVTKMKSITYHEIMDTLQSTAEYKIDLHEFNRVFGSGMVEVGKEIEFLIKNGKFTSNTPEFLAVIKQLTARMHSAANTMRSEKLVQVLHNLANDMHINLKNPSVNHPNDVAIFQKIKDFLKRPGNPSIKLKILGEPGSVESQTYLTALEQMFKEQGEINSKNAGLYKRYWNAAKKDTGYKGLYMGVEDAPKLRKTTVAPSVGSSSAAPGTPLSKGRMPQFFKDFLHSYVFSLKAFKNQGLGVLWSACMAITLVSNMDKLNVTKNASPQAKDTLKQWHLNQLGYPCWFITMPYVAFAGWLTEVTGSNVISSIWQQINKSISGNPATSPAKTGNATDGYAPVNPLLRGPIGNQGYELEKQYKANGNKFKKPQQTRLPKTTTTRKPSSVYQNQSPSQNNIGNRQQQTENKNKIDKDLFGG